MRFRTFLTYLSLLPLSACTRSCNDYDNNEEFSRAALPAYTETGAGTLGCQLGPQTWTVLGKHEVSRIGSPWMDNGLEIDGSYAVPPFVAASGRMTGVRNSKTFYDMQLSLSLRLDDTLSNARKLGAPVAGASSGQRYDYLVAQSFLNLDDSYQARLQRPVRLLIRKLDRPQRIISGTFEGWLYGGASGKDSLAVTDGRFDLRY